ncbi:MAG: hypothetical protein H6845_00025 [Alphaproteobacteria bacterium]|nr:MAG: hypothetical protein H6845_00025 [Alphaproteobacteria bacterium]
MKKVTSLLCMFCAALTCESVEILTNVGADLDEVALKQLEDDKVQLEREIFIKIKNFYTEEKDFLSQLRSSGRSLVGFLVKANDDDAKYIYVGNDNSYSFVYNDTFKVQKIDDKEFTMFDEKMLLSTAITIPSVYKEFYAWSFEQVNNNNVENATINSFLGTSVLVDLAREIENRSSDEFDTNNYAVVGDYSAALNFLLSYVGREDEDFYLEVGEANNGNPAKLGDKDYVKAMVLYNLFYAQAVQIIKHNNSGVDVNLYSSAIDRFNQAKISNTEYDGIQLEELKVNGKYLFSTDQRRLLSDDNLTLNEITIAQAMWINMIELVSFFRGTDENDTVGLDIYQAVYNLGIQNKPPKNTLI